MYHLWERRQVRCARSVLAFAESLCFAAQSTQKTSLQGAFLPSHFSSVSWSWHAPVLFSPALSLSHSLSLLASSVVAARACISSRTHKFYLISSTQHAHAIYSNPRCRCSPRKTPMFDVRCSPCACAWPWPRRFLGRNSGAGLILTVPRTDSSQKDPANRSRAHAFLP